MIKIIAGGKKHSGEYSWIIRDYEKRVRKPFDFSWQFFEGEKLEDYLAKWPFNPGQFVIVADERGEIISSPDLARTFEREFTQSKEIVIIVGGAYGIPDEIREKADMVWSFSKLVFPHMIARLIIAEQIYRAQEIARGGQYHHE